MELITRLDRSRYQWLASDVENADPAAMLVEVTTPPLPSAQRAIPVNMVVVLDRSGSMSGDRLEHARSALCDVVDRLSPGDTFGLVTFDDKVDVAIPAGPVKNPEAIKQVIRSVRAGGSTDLAAGLIRGLKEARRLESDNGVRVLLISDGHANRGVTDPAIIGPKVAEFVDARITTSCLGVGLGYDEALLDVIAREGTGEMHFAAEADTAAGAIAQECGELLGHRFLQCRLTISPGNGVGAISVVNTLATRTLPTGDIVVEIGNLASDQTRSIALLLDSKPAPKPGRRKFATIRVSYTLADDLSDNSTSQTVWAQIAGPDDSPARVDRDVTAEVLFQQIQRLSVAASEALQRFDFDSARAAFHRIIQTLRSQWSHIPRLRRPEFEAEIDRATAYLQAIEFEDRQSAALASKSSRQISSELSRRRGRRQP